MKEIYSTFCLVTKFNAIRFWSVVLLGEDQYGLNLNPTFVFSLISSSHAETEQDFADACKFSEKSIDERSQNIFNVKTIKDFKRIV